MTTLEEKVGKVKQIEAYCYILELLYAKEHQRSCRYWGNLVEPLRPREPQKTWREIEAYPPYDEDYYLRKVKENEKGKYSSFRDQCFLAAVTLASTLIGLLICWIPLVVGIFSLPFQVGARRQAAYQMYLDECEEIKRRNQGIVDNERRYAEESAKYKTAMEEYEIAVLEYDRKKRLLEEKKERALKIFGSLRRVENELQRIREKVYNLIAFPSNCKNYISVYMIDFYWKKGYISTLQEGITRHNQDEANGMFIPDVSLTLKHKNIFSQKMPGLVEELLECEVIAQSIFEELEKYVLENWSSDCASSPLPLTEGLICDIQATKI